MSFRFITKSIHAYLIDYPVAIVLIAAPFVLKLGQSGPFAMWLSVVVGVAALLLAALTDHPTGLVHIIPYWLHLWVDRAVGVVFPWRKTMARWSSVGTDAILLEIESQNCASSIDSSERNFKRSSVNRSMRPASDEPTEPI